MATELQLDRRQFLSALATVGLCMALPVARAASPLKLTLNDARVNTLPARLLAAWRQADGLYQVGVLQFQPELPELFNVQLAVDLPTRPHGLMHLQGNEYLVIARRPGDWMLRLNIQTGITSRIWQDADRHVNGHSAVHGNLLYTTETDLLTGSGMLGVRNKTTLELLDVWPTQGHDPHEMLVMKQGDLGIEQPFLLVANGGIQTHADMGRTTLSSSPMDSSLVALHPDTGAVLRQWVLDDARLSLRHLARHTDGVVGIALQAQHLEEIDRNAAPVLALLDKKGLRTVPASTDLKGYAGDIAATPEGFAISCTQSNSALTFDMQGGRIGEFSAQSACALAEHNGHVWLGHLPDSPASSAKDLVLDNHWLVLQAQG